MNPFSLRLLQVWVFTLLLTGNATHLFAEEVIPRIAITDTPLLDAIKTLARQGKINYIVDPHVPGACCGDASKETQPKVSLVWTNTTPQAALNALLANHQLTIVTNPATTVARIAPTTLNIKPIPSSEVGTNGIKTVPLIALESAPLTEVISTLGSLIGLEISFDPQTPKTTFDGQATISLHWEKISAAQALAALLDNYGMVMKQDPSASTGVVALKPTK